MNFCPYCGKDLQSEQLFCSHCGKPLNGILNKVPFTKSSRFKNKKVFVSVALSFLVLIVVMLILIRLVDNTQTPSKYSSSHYSTPSNESVFSAKDMLSSGFYKHIGLTKEQLIKTLGEPSDTKNDIMIYEEAGWRQIYGFINGKVNNATYQELSVDPSIIHIKIYNLESDLDNCHFWFFSDRDNIKRYTDGRYEINIMPIKTDDGTYNLGLMAFRK